MLSVIDLCSIETLARLESGVAELLDGVYPIMAVAVRHRSAQGLWYSDRVYLILILLQYSQSL